MPDVSIETLLLVLIVVGLVGVSACFAIGFPRALRERREGSAEAAVASAVPESTADRGEAPVEVSAPAPSPPAAPTRPPDLRSGLRKSRRALVGRLEALLRGRSTLDHDALDEIEALLFGADLGVRTAEDLLAVVRDAGSPDQVTERLRARALEILAGTNPDQAEIPERDGTPRVVLVVGVNGSGKTTTIGRLAARAHQTGQQVLIAAADTFRAAAIDQVVIWAERAQVEVVRGVPGGDPAAVAFDAVEAALAREMDLVLVDTAGRLQTQAGLMDELAKISKVIARRLPGAPHEVLLVLDANTGQNAIRQAQEFSRAVGVTGIVLTKLDGTAKGGVVLGIAQEVGVPVRFIGVGEGIEDLCAFDAESFVRALFTQEPRPDSQAGEAEGKDSISA